MNITYDKTADAVYVYFTKSKIDQTMEIGENMLVDIDALGNTVGIEILAASSQNDLIDRIKENSLTGVPVSISA